VHLSCAADRVRLGTYVLRNVYLALRCQKFIGLGTSNPSCIIFVRNRCGGDCILLRRPLPVASQLRAQSTALADFVSAYTESRRGHLRMHKHFVDPATKVEIAPRAQVLIDGA
jgi:hypothetical protein